MTQQSVSIDIREWERALSRFAVPEAALLAHINQKLADEGGHLACQVGALRYATKTGRNWAVAQFVLGDSEVADTEDRLTQIATLIVDAGDGIDVVWPSVALH